MINNLTTTGDKEFPFIDKNGCSFRSCSEYLQSEILNFCGCGDPIEILKYIRDFLDKVDKKEFNGYENTHSMFLSYWADNQKFTEHGSSIGFCWLTDLGKEFLNDLNWVLENEKEED